MSGRPVVIVGGGLAGLSCARALHARGVDLILLEASDGIGGRVRTDIVDGFRLDRGFQVLQTAYPEAQRVLDYPLLQLHAFKPGALIRSRGRFIRMSDPWRQPSQALATAFNGVGDLADRWKLAKLRRHVTQSDIEQLWNDPDSTTLEYLKTTIGLSSDIIERFFKPWFSGVFFEKDLATSSRFFKFIFRMFTLGDAALPDKGMESIPKQMAAGIPPEMLRLSTRVASIDGGVRLASGDVVNARAVVLAVEGPEAARLSGGRVDLPLSRSTTCFYFAAPEAPFDDPLLVLNGESSGPINNLCVPSNVASSYAPAGQALVSASFIGTPSSSAEETESNVRHQLREWYGSIIDRWTLIRRYDIHHALPSQAAHFRDSGAVPPRLAMGLYHCGDYCETASIHGALVSGRRAAESLLADLSAGLC